MEIPKSKIVGYILKITKLKNSWINYEKNKYENKKFDYLGKFCEYKNLKIVGKILKSINSKNSSENFDNFKTTEFWRKFNQNLQ